MTTVSDVTRQPASGLIHIDALLDQGPGWNWLMPMRTTLTYSFSLAGANNGDVGSIYTGSRTAFNAAQQSAVVQALAELTALTGIPFQAVNDGAAADLHFSAANLVGSGTTGYASTLWNYQYNGSNVITAYEADAWIYLDNVEFAAASANPVPGSDGYEVLLHELGHALGLKHPFEGSVQLPDPSDHTGNTLMSYTEQGGPHDEYAPFDVAALMFLYGGDGLGGALGQGGSGLYLVGTAAADTLTGAGGDDTIDGGGGIDTALYNRSRAEHLVQRSGNGSLTVQATAGSDGRDTLTQVERLAFSDQSLAFDLDGHAGTTARYLGAVFGPGAVGNKAYAGIGLSRLDGGTPASSLMQLALEARLGPGFAASSLVDVLYFNLVGSLPSAADQAFWVGTLATGQYTPVTLAQMAAALDLNAQNIELAGLAGSGLAFV